MAPPSTGAALQNLTVADADALNCGVCFLPLKPPIFQCPVGHVLCSQCSNKLLAWDMYCYVCCIPLVLGYRRSHDMEKLVESIRAPCPNAAYGCDAKPAYYHLQPHLEACLHQPCHCPECGFVGGTKTLLAHFTAAHQWPCTTHVRTGESFHMELRDGFNVADGATTKLLFLACLHEPCHCPDEGCGFVGGTKALLAHFTAAHEWPCTTHVRTGESFHMELHDGFNVIDIADGAGKLVFLVMVSRESLGRAISAICVKADVGDNEIYGLELECDRHRCWHGDRQKSCFDVGCTDLSNGLPHRDACFHFLVPIIVQPSDDTGTINIKTTIPSSWGAP